MKLETADIKQLVMEALKAKGYDVSNPIIYHYGAYNQQPFMMIEVEGDKK